ncbi:type II toxin-antitoxin system VapC family toxin [Bosea sp. 685]|uniref:type II toxin-antitoxin system VapC family toxin n=1 Tax=Bosea sp. 685 TaxID=3080057 RepID=UPI002893408A|nr:type II toxin-antitoxin system VapC family toxin [Bosea sp. 685]WNJ89369.1 type II toxin-antitoxin system VapC family toxin [Bosea sp. 685]
MNLPRIVIDSSAMIAILQGEHERAAIVDSLDRAGEALCSTVSFVETFMVASQRLADFDLDRHRTFLRRFGIQSSAVDEEQSILAAEAFLRFGRGRHPAKLNMGDRFSYALAKSWHAPLLYKGEDFAKTDIASAMAPGVRP